MYNSIKFQLPNFDVLASFMAPKQRMTPPYAIILVKAFGAKLYSVHKYSFETHAYYDSVYEMPLDKAWYVFTGKVKTAMDHYGPDTWDN